MEHKHSNWRRNLVDHDDNIDDLIDRSPISHPDASNLPQSSTEQNDHDPGESATFPGKAAIMEASFLTMLEEAWTDSEAMLFRKVTSFLENSDRTEDEAFFDRDFNIDEELEHIPEYINDMTASDEVAAELVADAQQVGGSIPLFSTGEEEKHLNKNLAQANVNNTEHMPSLGSFASINTREEEPHRFLDKPKSSRTHSPHLPGEARKVDSDLARLPTDSTTWNQSRSLLGNSTNQASRKRKMADDEASRTESTRRRKEDNPALRTYAEDLAKLHESSLASTCPEYRESTEPSSMHRLPARAMSYPDPAEHELFPRPDPASQYRVSAQSLHRKSDLEAYSSMRDSFGGQMVDANASQDHSISPRLTRVDQNDSGDTSDSKSENHNTLGHSTRYLQLQPRPSSIYGLHAPTQPGPGGPGTWPGAWIQLKFARERNKYPAPFPKGSDRIPAGHELWVYCFFFPNHIWAEGLDPFLDNRWGGHEIWDEFADEAQEACKKNDKFVGRPWNFIQQALGRRQRTREEARHRQQDVLNDLGDVAHLPRSQKAPSKATAGATTTQKSKTAKTNPVREVETQPNSSLDARSGPVSYRNLLRPSKGDEDAGRNPSWLLHQPSPGISWWEDSLRRQGLRIRNLQREKFPGFAELSSQDQARMTEASMHLHFEKFLQKAWPRIYLVLVHQLRPMEAFHALYRQLNQSSAASKEDDFCDKWMRLYLDRFDEDLREQEKTFTGAFNGAQAALIQSGLLNQGETYGPSLQPLHDLPQASQTHQNFDAPVEATRPKGASLHQATYPSFLYGSQSSTNMVFNHNAAGSANQAPKMCMPPYQGAGIRVLSLGRPSDLADALLVQPIPPRVNHGSGPYSQPRGTDPAPSLRGPNILRYRRHPS